MRSNFQHPAHNSCFFLPGTLFLFFLTGWWPASGVKMFSFFLHFEFFFHFGMALLRVYSFNNFSWFLFFELLGTTPAHYILFRTHLFWDASHFFSSKIVTFVFLETNVLLYVGRYIYIFFKIHTHSTNISNWQHCFVVV